MRRSGWQRDLYQRELGCETEHLKLREGDVDHTKLGENASVPGCWRPERAERGARLFMVSAVVLGVVMLGPLPARGAPAAGQTDLVLVLDTSKSMKGLAGGTNIFGQVKATCKELVKELATGDTVTLIAFDTDVRPEPTVVLVTDTEKVRLFSMIDSFRADGNWTFTSQALERGLKEAERLEAAFSDHNQVVAILTDGLNDPPPAMKGSAPTLDEVTRPYTGKPWYVFQVQLGPKVDLQLGSAISVFPHGKTIHDPRGADLTNLPGKLKPPPPPQAVKLVVSPASLRLALTRVGQAASGAVSVQLPADLSGKDLRVSLALDGAPATLATETMAEGATAGQVTIRVRATTAQTIPNATYQGRLTIALAESAASYRAAPELVSVTIDTALVPPSWPYWLAGFVLLAAAVAAAFLSRRWLQARRLFGQLEAWPKDQPAQITHVQDLSTFGAGVALGNEGIVLPGVNRRLGTLRVGSLDGERHVILRPETAERLTLQGRTQPELGLFNGDSFELGSWVFRYRGETGRRR